MATHAIIKRNHKIAIRECESFIDLNQNNIKDIEEFPYLKVKTKDGEIYYFLDGIEYKEWKIGRTYYIDGEKFHSGYPISDILLPPTEPTEPIYGDSPQNQCDLCKTECKGTIEEQIKKQSDKTMEIWEEMKWKS